MGFVILFAPCSSFCLYKVYSKETIERKFWEVIFTLLAKTSIVFFPLMSLFGEKDIRKKLFNTQKDLNANTLRLH